MKTKAQLTIDGRETPIELPVYEGSTGPDVVDVRSLVGEVSLPMIPVSFQPPLVILI